LLLNFVSWEIAIKKTGGKREYNGRKFQKSPT